ncbi:MAG: DUF932 domain-containing protein [Alphaproteobacteria bacterium]|nr:DUF932 domain-containing protein [Alphaproteobacteria bacterium]
MKLGRSLTDLATEIDRQAKAKQDYVASTTKLKAVPGLDPKATDLVIEDIGWFPLRDLALTQIGERTGIPTKYLRRMQDEAPELLADNINHWFHETPERRMVRTLDGTVRAFLSDKYQRIDNFDVANVVLPVLHDIPGLRILSTEVTEHRLYIKAATSALTRELKSRRVGDLVEAGVMISNSEVGLGAVTVSPFALFLTCLNGAVREGGKRWNHIGRHAAVTENPYLLISDETKAADDRAQLLMVRDTLKSALNAEMFDRWLDKVQGTTGRRLEGDVGKAVEVLANSLSLTKDEQSSVLRHLIEGGDLSQYGLFNAVTRTAEDSASYDRATELETLGGRVIELNPSEWRELAIAA